MPLKLPLKPTGTPTVKYEYENECFFGENRLCVVLQGIRYGWPGPCQVDAWLLGEASITRTASVTPRQKSSNIGTETMVVCK
jgi:hypothetical protein